MPDTTYIVLQHAASVPDHTPPVGDNVWDTIGKIDAGSAEAAVKALLATFDKVIPGKYVAVPARSWKPVQVQAVQTTTIKIT